MGKIFFFVIFLFMSQNMMSQLVTDKEMVRLKTNQLYFRSRGLDLREYDFSQNEFNQRLNLVLTSRNKKATNTTIGVVFLCAGMANLIGAATLDKGNNRVTQAVNGLVSTGYITSGIIASGLSIPFFISANKRSKEMDYHLTLAKEMYGQY